MDLITNFTTISPEVPLNETKNDFLKESFDFKNNPGLVYVTIACGCTSVWLLFITFYFARCLGFLLTKILNCFYIKEGHIYIGSFSFSILSGKFMFRDVRYVTKDYSCQIVDGLAILKWWLLYRVNDDSSYKDFTKDEDLCETSHSRLMLQINGFEFHIYNRSDLYNNIQDILKCERYGDACKSVQSLDHLKDDKTVKSKTESGNFNMWRDLFPIIRLNIRSGKLAIGNRLLETTTWVHFNTAYAAYSMPDAPSTLDFFTHYLQCKCDDVRILMSKSQDYKGTTTDPPRFMGQGFVVLQSGQAKFTYYQDEPGLVPTESDISSESDPEWGLDISFTKSTTITYGPWVDKQRDALQKFFLPNNFQELAVNKPVEAQQVRAHTGFDMKLQFDCDVSLDLLYSKDKETSAIHVCYKAASFHYHQPWIVNEYGYTSSIVANLKEIQVSTSLQFHKILECDMIEVAVNMTIPRMWNQFQHWTCEFWLVKSTVYFIYDHQTFFSDLIADWSSSEPADIATFVPFEWEFNIYLRDYEILLLVNEHNWIDCSNENENNEVALCGESLEVNFTLPFTHFQPEQVETKFFFCGETIMLRSFLPESNTLRRSVISLARSSDRDMYPKENNASSLLSDFDQVDGADNFDEVDSGVNLEDQLSKGWRRRTATNQGWVDIWSVPVIILNMFYKYHSVPVNNAFTKVINKRLGMQTCDDEIKDMSEAPPDVITIELEAGPSAIRIFGHFWRQFFLGFKGNYFGMNQKSSPFNAHREVSPHHSSDINSNEVNHSSRPLEANVSVVLLDIQAELTNHTSSEMVSPLAYIDRITFEMHKTYEETRLQLIVSPISLILTDSLKRHADHHHLSKGFLTLSGLQFRGHALFSDKDRPLGVDTLEYAWLMEIQCGVLKGKVTPLELQSLVSFLETFLLHTMDEENSIFQPNSVVKCQHDAVQADCKMVACHNKDDDLCPTEDDLKYNMIRFSFEAVNLFITEVECACNITASPIRFSTCDVQNGKLKEGGSFFINEISIRQFIQQVNLTLSDTYPQHYIPSHSNSWVEVAVLGLGPVTADISQYHNSEERCYQQMLFLQVHDHKNKQLWFLWKEEDLKDKLASDRCKSKICGCVGGCNFFGANNNGVRFFTTQPLNATSEKYSRYGSESLWGNKKEAGSSIKEHLMRRSEALSLGKSHSTNNFKGSSSYTKSFSSPSGGGMDVVDFGNRSASVSNSRKHISTNDSKLVFGRSQSILNGGVSGQSLRRYDSEEGTFYSCNSEAELYAKSRGASRDKTPVLSIKTTGSSESFVSAMSSTDDVIDIDMEDSTTKATFKTLVNPALLSSYTNYMQPVTCINWRQNVPSAMRKKFSLLKNLKVICPPGHRCNLPNIPNFNPSVHGKLPFSIVHNEKEQLLLDVQNLKENKNKDFNDDKRSGKTIISIKFHQQVTAVVTPLLINAVDKYVDSFNSLPNSYQLPNIVDSLHLECIKNSKQKYKLHETIKTLLTDQLDMNLHKVELNKTIPPTFTNVFCKLPCLKLILLQVPNETYIASEQSSLSGQCGSEYSNNLDINSTDSVLLAACISNVSIKYHQNTENDALFGAVKSILHKSTVNHINANSVQLCSTIMESNLILGTANADNLQCQLIHLKGSNDKSPHVTSLPPCSSNVDFKVKLGGNLYLDNTSSSKDEDSQLLGSIIFEAGVNDVSAHIGYEKKLLKETKQPKKERKNTKSQSRSETHPTGSTPCNNSDSVDGTVYSQEFSNTFSNSSSSIGSFSHHKPDIRKGYVALDIDSGDVADTSEIEDDLSEEKVTLMNKKDDRLSPAEAVYFKKGQSNSNLGINPLDHWKVYNEFKGNLLVQKTWLHLAAPTNLRAVHEENEHDVNLVTVLVPSLSCWVPTLISTINTIDVVNDVIKTWKYSAFASLLGQALPEQGRLLKKHITNSAATTLSRFLQEEYSSQLICVLRRQTYGHRLNNIKIGLNKKHFIPPAEDLEKGIHALIRQWKCVIIGAEGVDERFASTLLGSKKPVVGRGLLTKRDLEFLKKDSESKGSESTSHLQASSTSKLPVQPKFSEDVHSPSVHSPSVHSPTVDIPYAESDSDSSDEDGQSIGSKCKSTLKDTPPQEETLYAWMSKSPVSSIRHLNSVHVESTSDKSPRENTTAIDEEVKSVSYNVLRSTTPMVSLPTSGMQLADASEVFSSLLNVLGISYVKNEMLAENLYNFNLNLTNVVIHAIPETNNTSSAKKFSPVTPALTLQNFSATSLIKQSSAINTLVVEKFLKDVIFNACLRESHLHINFALVRLILQISETFNVIKEQKQYAEKLSHNQNVPAAQFQWEHLFASLSDPEVEMPKCWQNMYNVMNLYELLPTSCVSSQHLGSPESQKRSKLDFIIKGSEQIGLTIPKTISKDISALVKSSPEHLLSVTGTGSLKKVLITASISGIEMDFEVNELNGTFFKEQKKLKDVGETFSNFEETSSGSVHLEKLKVRLIESVKAFTSHDTDHEPTPPDLKISRTLLTCKIYRSHAMHTVKEKKPVKANQKSLVYIGPIVVEIPQHPGALRSIVAQFSKRFQKHFTEFDDYYQSRKEHNVAASDLLDIHSMKESLTSFTTSASFRLNCNNIVVSAVLLPSLRAEYKIEQINGWGNLNGKAKFVFDLPYHVLSFNTKVLVVPLPATTHIDLPPVKVQGRYLEISHPEANLHHTGYHNSHGYLRVSVDVGSLEQNLTTDLLNHLIFLQKGFIKEVSDVVNDVENNDPLPLWKATSVEHTQQYPMIYNIQLTVKKIHISATTPSTNGVQLETGEISIELSNQSPSSSVLNIPESLDIPKLYGKAQVQLNISLRQFVKMQDTNEQQLNVYANFATKLIMTNSLKDKQKHGSTKETVLIALNNPQLYVMPAAVDKAVLVYLHYKNAYDYWRDQRMALSHEYPAAEQLLSRFPQAQNAAQSFTSYLFLQLNVNNLGICLPLKETNVKMTTGSSLAGFQDDSNVALLVTVDETSITCCGTGTFVSAGLFRKFCLRFADDFDHTASTWLIDESEIRNTYSIPEGSYNLCSRTVYDEAEGANVLPGKWVMNILWKMCGVNIHIDSNIGKRLSLLTNALTAITGDSDVADLSSIAEVEDDLDCAPAVQAEKHGLDMVDGVFSMEENSLEKRLLLQTRTVNQLRRNNAHADVIRRELKILQDIETLVTNEFFKDVKRRIKRRKSRRSTGGRRKSSADRSFFLAPTSRRRERIRSISVPVLSKSSVTQSPGYDTVDAPTDSYFEQQDMLAEHREKLACVDEQQPTESFDIISVTEDMTNDLPQSDESPMIKTKVQFSESTNDMSTSPKSTNKMKSSSANNTTALNFELDVIVDIDSGKCTLHTGSTELVEDDTFSPLTNLKKSRKTSDQTDLQTKRSTPNHRVQRPIRSVSGSATSTLNSNISTEETIILIPGVNVKVHYTSINTSRDNHAFNKDIEAPLSDTSSINNPSNRYINKTGSLNAFISIQSLPKEMVVKPSLLDFIEKALEPIIHLTDQVDGDEDSDSVTASESVLSSGSSLDSFPVHVVALIRIAPSDILFSCLPISKVECLLRIPSLDIAIASTPSQDLDGIPSSKRKTPLFKRNSGPRTSQSSEGGDNLVSSIGSSFTVCLSRFSFCIFHPYGKQYGLSGDTKPGLFSSKRGDNQRAMSGRKDSLSLNVEFIKVNVHRRITKIPASCAVPCEKVSEKQDRTVVKISALCDIGSAAFNYDMRRLNEILDVPKAWYKRGLMQRLFLGKEGAYATQTSMNQTKSERSSSKTQSVKSFELKEPFLQPEKPIKNKGTSHRRALSTGAGFFGNLMGSPFPAPRSATIGSRQDILFKFDGGVGRRRSSIQHTESGSHDSDYDETDGPSNAALSVTEWETNVAVAFNVSRVDVSSNMGNVMGQAVWSTNDFRTNANLMLNSTGLNKGSIEVAVRQGSFDAHGGVIGGYLELQEIHASGRFENGIDELPKHLSNVSMRCGEVRIDYMGSSILMATLSSFTANVEDEWTLGASKPNKRTLNVIPSFVSDLTTPSEEKELNIQIKLKTGWDEFQIILSRSTTPDFIKIITKLEEFLSQQHRSSVRALSSLRTPSSDKKKYYSRARESTMSKQEGLDATDGSSNDAKGLKYQHWIELINGLHLIHLRNIDTSNITEKNISLSGRLDLHGSYVSLACFHGPNFRSQNWALFTFREPDVSFSTGTKIFEKSCHVMRASAIHKASFSLGSSKEVPNTKSNSEKASKTNFNDFMATVRKVSRGRRNPPSLGAPVQEWLIFVNTTSNDGIPSMKASGKNESGEKLTHTKYTSGLRKVSFAPKYRYENESEIIFALPTLKLELTNEHDQPMSSIIAKILALDVKTSETFPTLPNIHMVDTNFLSHFDESINVSMDVGLLFYLHDLILSYMREKETSLSASISRVPRRIAEEKLEEATLDQNESAIKAEEKYREFRVKGWKLEPRIRLLSWAGKRMDPVSIDWVLEKLGFMHAALTIPKWMQRGALDPMDFTLATLMGHLLAYMKVREDALS